MQNRDALTGKYAVSSGKTSQQGTGQQSVGAGTQGQAWL